MSMPEAGQAAERDERGRDDYEQQQARVLVALMQSFCAARYRKADNTPCPIEQGLYLGSVGAALNKEALKSLNITHILIVARSLSPAFPAEFNYKKIEVLDSPDTDLLKHFDECFSFIDEAISSGGNVLVHCFAGRSRSVTIVVAYLMKKHQMSLESALSLVRSKRPQLAPNEGFISQLENFDKSLQGASASTSSSALPLNTEVLEDILAPSRQPSSSQENISLRKNQFNEKQPHRPWNDQIQG
nr:dual specificity protein phosphatase 1B-like isoform X2 [Setaria viridis]